MSSDTTMTTARPSPEVGWPVRAIDHAIAALVHLHRVAARRSNLRPGPTPIRLRQALGNKGEFRGRALDLARIGSPSPRSTISTPHGDMCAK